MRVKLRAITAAPPNRRGESAACTRLLPSPSGTTQSSISIKNLAAEPFILYRRHRGVGFYDLNIVARHQAGFSPNNAQEAPRIFSTLSLVAAGLGVAFVPASMRELNMPGVAYLSLKSKPVLKEPINMAWRSVDHSAAARNIINLVRKLARDETVNAKEL